MRKVLFVALVLLLFAVSCISIPGGCSFPAATTVNRPPTAYIDSITPPSAAPGEKITFIGHGTDPDGTVVAYRWRSSISGDLSVEAKFETKLDSGTHIIYFKVQDNAGAWSDEVRSSLIIAAGGATPPPSAALPVINSFTSSPATISSGGSSVLNWNVSGATSVSIDQGIGSVAASGNTSVSPAATTSYVLTATNAAGSVTATTQVVVSAPLPLGMPVINSFGASPASIIIGASTTLSWNVSGATSVAIDPGIGAVSLVGTKVVSPAGTTNYTLTASNAAGWVSQTIVVTVTSIPIIPLPLPPLLLVKTVGPLPNIDAENGGVQKDGATYTTYHGACAGDTSTNGTRRGFLSFDLSSIPAGATITEAILDLSAYTKNGNPTYGTLGFFEIYHYQYGTYANLGSDDYNAAGKLVKGGRFSSYPLSPWKFDVQESSTSEKVIQGLVDAHKTRAQFKIQFSNLTDGDSVTDFFCFENATLTIKYTGP